jgi:hypothetical protein
MDLEEVIFPIYLSDLVFQALLHILEPLAEVLVFLRDLLRGLLNELILPLDLGMQPLYAALKVNNVGVRCKEGLYNLFRDLLWSAGVVPNAHVCEGPGQPIIGDIFLEVGVLRIKPDKFISVGRTKDSGIGTVSQDLIAYGIGGRA